MRISHRLVELKQFPLRLTFSPGDDGPVSLPKPVKNSSPPLSNLCPSDWPLRCVMGLGFRSTLRSVLSASCWYVSSPSSCSSFTKAPDSWRPISFFAGCATEPDIEDLAEWLSRSSQYSSIGDWGIGMGPKSHDIVATVYSVLRSFCLEYNRYTSYKDM